MPPTRAIRQLEHFAAPLPLPDLDLPSTTTSHPSHANLASHSSPRLGSIQPDYHSHSHWNGTLSATLSASANKLSNLLFDPRPDNPAFHSPISTRPEPFFPWVRKARAFLSLTSRKRITEPIGQLSPSSVKFGLLCSLWYTTSALSSNTGKAILNRFRYPVTLTIVQFGFVAIWCALFIAIREGLVGNQFSGIKSRSPGGFWGIKLPNKTAIHGTLIMSLFSIAGHVFSSMAIARVPVSTVHTIKVCSLAFLLLVCSTLSLTMAYSLSTQALSPLFTVMAYAALFGVRYSIATYFSLLPLTLGVMLTCSFDLRANGTGFLCALGSTVIFVSQNIYGKKLLPRGNDDAKNSASKSSSNAKMDKLNLLFFSSGIAFLFMIPIWIWADLITIFKLWLNTPLNQPNASPSSNQTSSLMLYFFCNGTVHFAQCIIAFSILSQTSPVTYSIASLIKRIAVICIAIIWFGQPVSAIQAFGMLLTFSGLYIYNQSKSSIEKGERKRGQLERQHDLLLPRTQVDAKDLAGNSSEEEDLFATRRRPAVPEPKLSVYPTSPLPPPSTNALASSSAHRVHALPPTTTYSPVLNKYHQPGSVSSSNGLPSVFKPVPVR